MSRCARPAFRRGQLRVLLVHDNAARSTTRFSPRYDDGHWYILDNRWTAAVEDTDVRNSPPSSRSTNKA